MGTHTCHEVGGQAKVGTARKLRKFNYPNVLTRIARTRDSHDAIRVLVVRAEGYQHLEKLRPDRTRNIGV